MTVLIWKIFSSPILPAIYTVHVYAYQASHMKYEFHALYRLWQSINLRTVVLDLLSIMTRARVKYMH